MNLVFVVYAFLLGAVMDIGSMIGTTEIRVAGQSTALGETAEDYSEPEPASEALYDTAFVDASEPQIAGDNYRDPEPTPTQNATMGKAAKKSKNSQQHPDQGTPTTPPTRDLLVQTGRDCSITTHAASGDYRLRATIGNATVVFSERPVQTAGIIATPKFVENFKELFNTSAPNAAITFARDNIGPLIVILSRPSIIGSSIIEYTLTQSNSQGAVASITQFIDMSGVSCSIFIDSVAANSFPW